MQIIKLEESITLRNAFTRSCVALIAVGAGAVSCAEAPVRKDPTITAAAAAQAHCGKGPEEDPRIFTPDLATGVSPVTREYRLGRANRQVLAGAELAIRAQPGLTSEWISRSLICHQAHRLLGQGAAPQDDAYWLSGSWLEFGVRSRGDLFFVDIYADDPESASAVLARTRAFVSHRGVAPEQSSL